MPASPPSTSCARFPPAPASAELLVTAFSADGARSPKGEAKSFDAVDAVKRELERSITEVHRHRSVEPVPAGQQGGMRCA